VNDLDLHSVPQSASCATEWLKVRRNFRRTMESLCLVPDNAETRQAASLREIIFKYGSVAILRQSTFDSSSRSGIPPDRGLRI
jgi:hypothetical protein